jgi:hypothetical protein
VPAPPKLPKWIDEAAVADLVAAEMEELRSKVERLDAIHPGPLPPLSEDLEEVRALMVAEANRGWPVEGQKEAVAAALRGDVAPLADLLRPDATILDMLESNLIDVKTLSPSELRTFARRLCVRTLSPSTWSLIAQFLTGERSLRTGRLKGERGRPTLSPEKRRAESPVHDAAEEVDAIRAILRRLYYPDQSSSQIRDRAMEITAQRNGVELDTLVNYLKRPRKDRRRLTT